MFKIIVCMIVFGASAWANHFFLLSHVGFGSLDVRPRVYYTASDPSVGEEPRGRTTKSIASMPMVNDKVRSSYAQWFDDATQKSIVIDGRLMDFQGSKVSVLDLPSKTPSFKATSKSYEAFKDDVQDYLDRHKGAFVGIAQESKASQDILFGGTQDNLYVIGAYLNPPRGRVDVFEQNNGSRYSHKVIVKVDAGFNLALFRYDKKSQKFIFSKEFLHQSVPIYKDPNAQGASFGKVAVSGLTKQVQDVFDASLSESMASLDGALQSFLNGKPYMAQATQSAQDGLDFGSREQPINQQVDSAFANDQLSDSSNPSTPSAFGQSGTNPLQDSSIFKDEATLHKANKIIGGNGAANVSAKSPMPPNRATLEQPVATNSVGNASTPQLPQASTYTVGGSNGNYFAIQNAPQLRIDSWLKLSSNTNQGNSIGKVIGFDEQPLGMLVSGYVVDGDSVEVLGMGFGEIHAQALGVNVPFVASGWQAQLAFVGYRLGYANNLGHTFNLNILSETYLGLYYEALSTSQGKYLANIAHSIKNPIDPMVTLKTDYTPGQSWGVSGLGVGFVKRFYLPMSVFGAVGFDVGRSSVKGTYALIDDGNSIQANSEVLQLSFDAWLVEPKVGVAYVINEAMSVEGFGGYRMLFGTVKSPQKVAPQLNLGSQITYGVRFNYSL